LVVGNLNATLRRVSFQYFKGTVRPLSIPGAPIALVFGTNSTGTAVVGWYYQGAPTPGFIYQTNAVQMSWFPGSYSNGAYGVNDAGDVCALSVSTGANVTGRGVAVEMNQNSREIVPPLLLPPLYATCGLRIFCSLFPVKTWIL
jgi:uncharacterized membrane protein